MPFCPIPFCPYTILSVPFCPLPFCPRTLSSCVTVLRWYFILVQCTVKNSRDTCKCQAELQGLQYLEESNRTIILLLWRGIYWSATCSENLMWDPSRHWNFSPLIARMGV